MREALSWRLAGFESSGRDPSAGRAAETASIGLRRGQFALPVSVPSDHAGATFRRAMVHSWFGNHDFRSVVGFSHGRDFDRLIYLRGKKEGGVNYYTVCAESCEEHFAFAKPPLR